MKTLSSLFVFLYLVISVTVDAQINKTQLSLDVSQKYQKNYALLSQYTWNRQVDATMDGKPVLFMLSSVTIGPEGSPVAQLISKQSDVEKKPGMRGEMQEKGQAEMKEYIKNAIELSEKYIFMTEGQMADLFNKGTLSELNNLLRAEAFNFLVQGDHLVFSFDRLSLQYMKQSFTTIMNGDPIQAEIIYIVINGVNTVNKITLSLPAKKVNVIATCSNYAKKL
jgi:hypothetical protein